MISTGQNLLEQLDPLNLDLGDPWHSELLKSHSHQVPPIKICLIKCGITSSHLNQRGSLRTGSAQAPGQQLALGVGSLSLAGSLGLPVSLCSFFSPWGSLPRPSPFCSHTPCPPPSSLALGQGPALGQGACVLQPFSLSLCAPALSEQLLRTGFRGRPHKQAESQ